MPAGARLTERLDSVLEVLYLMFNEGYAAWEGDRLLRAEVCEEPLRLAELLAGYPETGLPKTQALVALFLLQSARNSARTDADGYLLLLRDQDRSLWDRPRIDRGLRRLDLSACGGELSVYHLEAGIAAAHAIAPGFAGTDWSNILELYDRLYALHPSPVVALNRAVALSRCHGPEAALRELDAVRNDAALARYHLLHATLGELNRESGRMKDAAACFAAALDCVCTEPERRFLAARLEHVQAMS